MGSGKPSIHFGITKLKYLLAFLTAVMAGCSVMNDQPIIIKDVSDCFHQVKVEGGKLVPMYCNDNQAWRKFFTTDYSISIPGNLFQFINSGDEIVFDSSFTNDPPIASDYYIKLLPHDSLSCSPTLTGVSHMTDIPDTGGETSWGKFDYEFSPDPKIGEGEFYCVPFKATPHLYVLCSEKDEKTVLICVSQVTDNPDLAKEIFETFRWLP